MRQTVIRQTILIFVQIFSTDDSNVTHHTRRTTPKCISDTRNIVYLCTDNIAECVDIFTISTMDQSSLFVYIDSTSSLEDKYN